MNNCDNTQRLRKKEADENRIYVSGEKYAGELLSDVLAGMNIGFHMPCGGHGLCGKCTVKLADGRTVKACSFTVPKEGLTVLSENRNDFYDTVGTKLRSSIDGLPTLVLDLGTTTLELASVLPDGGIASSVSALNPQRIYGDDVVSRISACEKGHLDAMRRLLADKLAGMMKQLAPMGAENLFVVGNPTMVHIFCGISPASIGRWPFRTGFDGIKQMNAEESLLPVGLTTVLPASSAYIGSDTVAGICYTGIADDARNVVLSDLGTNGETVLSVGGRLFTTSSAAGPALEGAGISCGTGGIPGAISSARTENGRIITETVGGLPPVGICGSGLCDIVSCSLKAGTVDRTGRITTGSGRLDIAPGISLTQKDVRAFQLAQSAVNASITTLCDAAGIAVKDIDLILLAGGLGSRINPASARSTGIIPYAFDGEIRQIGNSALFGAAKAAVTPEGPEECLKIAEKCINVELNSSGVFQKEFIKAMTFEL